MQFRNLPLPLVLHPYSSPSPPPPPCNLGLRVNEGKLSQLKPRVRRCRFPSNKRFRRLIKRKTKIFRPFDRLVLFRLPLQPPPLQRLKTSGDELISTKRLWGWLPPSFFLFLLLFFFFSSSTAYPVACSPRKKKFGRASRGGGKGRRLGRGVGFE